MMEKLHTLTYRWLGTAGLEFTGDGYTLLVDPFFTRPSTTALLRGARVPANAALAARYISRADALLVTHPHYDHVMDVPAVMQLTGARAYGSPNTCTLLAWHGIPEGQIQSVQVGDCFEVGPFKVTVFPAAHTRLPLSRLFNGALPAHLREDGPGGPQAKSPLPLRLWQYRMDTCFSFRIQAGERVILVGNHPVRADTVFLAPYMPEKELSAFLRAANPELIIPIHWDDFTQPLSRSIRPMMITAAQGLRPAARLLGRIDLRWFEQRAHHILPGARVQVPQIFQPVALLPAQ